MRRFAYFEPTTLGEAVSLLARYEGRAQALAGGTDLLVELKEQLRRAEGVVNLKKIPGMAGLAFDRRDGLSIGALVTAREVETSAVVLEKYASLAQAARELGSIQVRHRATIVGNVCRASPSADTLPPLVADGAQVRISGPAGERRVALEEFFTGPGRTVLAPGEIVTALVLPPPAEGTAKVYLKHGRRKAMELATVGVAVSLSPGGDASIVLGAVAPTVIRARKAEAVFRETRDVGRAAQAAAGEARPITNVRATAEYRREMVAVLTQRALARALELAHARN